MITDVCPACGHALDLHTAASTLLTCPACGASHVPPGATEVALLTRSEVGDTSKTGGIRLTPEFRSRYRLDRLLGSGAMGTVYRGVQGGTSRLVAIKFLLAPDSEEALARFLAEGRLLARISHANVLKVFDAGSMDGHPYLVTEYLPAGTLRDKLRLQPKVPVPEASRIALASLMGLEACHEAKIIHRDLKPENILLGAESEPKLADLGIAKALESDLALTGTCALIGTPRYMAPEQFTGSGASVASDLYAIGVILYEMLTGRRPFAAVKLVDLIREVTRSEPEPVRKLAPDVSRELEALVQRAMSREPGRRPASAGQFARELERCVVTDTEAAPSARRPAVSPVAGRDEHVGRHGTRGARDGRKQPRQEGASGASTIRRAITLAGLGVGLLVVVLLQRSVPVSGTRGSSVAPGAAASPDARSATPAATPTPLTGAFQREGELVHLRESANRLEQEVSSAREGKGGLPFPVDLRPPRAVVRQVELHLSSLASLILANDRAGLTGVPWLAIEEGGEPVLSGLRFAPEGLGSGSYQRLRRVLQERSFDRWRSVMARLLLSLIDFDRSASGEMACRDANTVLQAEDEVRLLPVPAGEIPSLFFHRLRLLERAIRRCKKSRSQFPPASPERVRACLLTVRDSLLRAGDQLLGTAKTLPSGHAALLPAAAKTLQACVDLVDAVDLDAASRETARGLARTVASAVERWPLRSPGTGDREWLASIVTNARKVDPGFDPSRPDRRLSSDRRGSVGPPVR
ncbi:MAG: protein kinase [Candidatus Riflebacteria bacterium]|nr:protein kinase [Candidatus Riflebacteria bacterium]